MPADYQRAGCDVMILHWVFFLLVYFSPPNDVEVTFTIFDSICLALESLPIRIGLKRKQKASLKMLMRVLDFHLKLLLLLFVWVLPVALATKDI